MRGRKPLPPNLKVIRGETRPSRLNPDHARPVEGRPNPPDWLSEEERAEFARYVERLEALGVLSATDDGIIALAALRWVEVRRLSEKIAREGYSYESIDRSGKRLLKRNPAVAMRSDAMKHLHALESSMGLTPSDRGRVSVSRSPASGNPFADLRRD